MVGDLFDWHVRRGWLTWQGWLLLWAWVRFIWRVRASICAVGVWKETEEKREERHFLRSITLIMLRRFLSHSNLRSLHTALSPSRPRFAAPLLTRHVTAQSGIRSLHLFPDCIARFYFSSIQFDFSCSYSNQALLPSERGSKMSCQLLPATSVRRFRPVSRYLRFFPCNQHINQIHLYNVSEKRRWTDCAYLKRFLCWISCFFFSIVVCSYFFSADFLTLQRHIIFCLFCFFFVQGRDILEINHPEGPFGTKVSVITFLNVCL